MRGTIYPGWGPSFRQTEGPPDHAYILGSQMVHIILEQAVLETIYPATPVRFSLNSTDSENNNIYLGFCRAWGDSAHECEVLMGQCFWKVQHYFLLTQHQSNGFQPLEFQFYDIWVGQSPQVQLAELLLIASYFTALGRRSLAFGSQGLGLGSWGNDLKMHLLLAKIARCRDTIVKQEANKHKQLTVFLTCKNFFC